MTNAARLSWPHSALSPNSRLHWSKRERHRKAAKHEGFYSALEAGMCAGDTIRITLHPPDNRIRDADNVLASLKAALDGVAAAVGQDDSDWVTIIIKRKNVIKGGAVIIAIHNEAS